MPAVHALQPAVAVRAVDDEKVLMGHGVGIVVPAVGPQKYPARHGRGLAMTGANEPVAMAAHAVNGEELVCPAGHSAQRAPMPPAEKVPAVHASHRLVLPVIPKPALHATDPEIDAKTPDAGLWRM